MSAAIEVRGLHYRAGKTFEIRDLDLTVPTLQSMMRAISSCGNSR